MKSMQLFFGLVLAGSLLVNPLTGFSQGDDSRIGVKAGVNLSNFYDNQIDDRNLRFGFHVGLFTEIAVSEYFSIQPELLLATRGNEQSYGDDGGLADDFGIEGDVRFNLLYIDLPILAKFTIGEVINLHAGPYVSYLLGANVSAEGDLIPDDTEDLDRDNFANWDYGLAVGAGVDLAAVSIGLRYNLSLNEIADSTESDLLLDNAKNSLLQAYVAIGI
jgi:hypothetical protein